MNLAGVYLKTGEHADALQQCKLALAMEKNSAKAWFRRGKAHMALGQDDEARAALAEARRLAPEDAAVRATIAQLDREEALKARARKQVFGGLFGAPPPASGTGSAGDENGRAEASAAAGGTGNDGGGAAGPAGGTDDRWEAAASTTALQNPPHAAPATGASSSRIGRFASWLLGSGSGGSAS